MESKGDGTDFFSRLLQNKGKGSPDQREINDEQANDADFVRKLVRKFQLPRDDNFDATPEVANEPIRRSRPKKPNDPSPAEWDRFFQDVQEWMGAYAAYHKIKKKEDITDWLSAHDTVLKWFKNRAYDWDRRKARTLAKVIAVTTVLLQQEFKRLKVRDSQKHAIEVVAQDQGYSIENVKNYVEKHPGLLENLGSEEKERYRQQLVMPLVKKAMANPELFPLFGRRR